MDQFYVVQTHPQKERLAVQELDNQGFPTFFPVIQHLPKIRRGKLEAPRQVALFPKYLFIQLDLELDRWRAVNGTRGVARLMCMDDEHPSVVPALIMQRLLDAGEVIEEQRAGLPFDVNDLVEFTDGSFKGNQGLVQMCSAARVTLLLSMLGGQVTVHTEPKMLRYVSKTG